MIEPVYEVFARKSREESLRHIGYVNAMDGDLARVYAWKTYDEQNWFEMCIVPRSAILSVNRPEPGFLPPRAEMDPIVASTSAASYGGSDVVTGGGE